MFVESPKGAFFFFARTVSIYSDLLQKRTHCTKCLFINKGGFAQRDDLMVLIIFLSMAFYCTGVNIEALYCYCSSSRRLYFVISVHVHTFS